MMPLAHLGVPFFPFLRRGWGVIDWRLLMLGSILPDLIDKPLGHLLLPLDNGRLFAHTIFFSIMVLALALRFRWMMAFSLGISSHHLLDSLFTDPRTSLWPLLGPFPSSDFEVSFWLDSYLRPEVLTFELIGASAIFLYFILNSERGPGFFVRSALTGRKGRGPGN